jgi:predicted MFS family arabinose efflux permease
VLIYAIIQAPDSGWGSPRTAIGFGVAAALLVAFGFFEWRNDTPMLDLRFFRNPRFAAATSTITLIFFAMYGTNFILTQYLQLVLGYSPLQAGLRILPIPVVFMAAAPGSARLVERYGQRVVVVGGLIVLAVGLAMLSRSGLGADYPYLFLGLSVTALGMGLTTAPSTGAIMESLPLGKAGVGSAVNDTTRELGGALGVAALGSILASHFRGGLAPALQALPTAARAAAGSLGGALSTAATLPLSTRGSFTLSARRAYVDALDVTLLVAVVGITLAAFLVAYLLRPVATELSNDAEAALEAA